MKRINRKALVRYIIGVGLLIPMILHWEIMGFAFGMLWLIGWTDGCELNIFEETTK